jgi:hypothetical protein
MRDCGSCRKCCEGWLSGEAYGHKFYKGIPCFYLGDKCSIYHKRPKEPCKNYICAWKKYEEVFPEWMKPDLINAIISEKIKGDMWYFEVMEAGKILDVRVLNWMIIWALRNSKNLVYYIDSGVNYIGSKEFTESIGK